MAAPTSEDFSTLSSLISTLINTVAENTAAKESGGGGGGGDDLAAAQKLQSQLDKLAQKVSDASNKIDTTSLASKLNTLGSDLQGTIQQIIETKRELSTPGLDEAKKAELVTKLEGLNSAVNTTSVAMNEQRKVLTTSLVVQRQMQENLVKFNQELKKSVGDEILTKMFGQMADSIKIVFNRFAQIVGDAMKMASEGIKQAANLSISAQQGVALQFQNQGTAIASAFKNLGDPNKIVNKDQLYAAQQGITDAMGGLAAGLQLDPDKIEKTVGTFREGLNSQITPTAEVFRSLSQIGIEPTTKGLTDLREASGRAGLGLTQMQAIAKNAMAIQIFGQGIVKTTLDLDRMGISIQSVMRQSESYVTNLDGAIDSIAQLNQLGVQLDFGELTRLQEFDPAGAMKYIADSISPQQLQSSSFRALLGSIPGVNIEEVLKLKGMEGLEKLEKETTEQAKEVSTGTKVFTGLTLMAENLSKSFVGLIVSAIGASIALSKLAASGALGGAGVNPGGPTSPLMAQLGAKGFGAEAMGARAAGGMKVGAGMGVLTGVMSGVTEYQQSGSISKAIARGLANLAGSIVGGALGQVLIPIPGVGAMVGAMAGSWLANFLVDKVFKTGDDIIDGPQAPTGYGDRTLVTPTAEIALNNDDTVLAGTKLLEKGTLSAATTVPQTSNNQATSQLLKTMNDFITQLKNAETTVAVNNNVQKKVPRFSVVGVMTRDEQV